MLETKGLLTVEDLLGYVPFRYEDRSNMKTIAQLAPGEMATVVAEVRTARVAGFRRRNLGLFDTWQGLIIPYLTFTLPLAKVTAKP